MQIVSIHGLNSSHRSFNYVHSKLPEHKIIPISYDSHQPMADSIVQVVRQLPKDRFSLIGHSLGGVLSVLIAAEHADKIDNLIVISAPLAGSKAAVLARWLPGHPAILRDIIPNAESIEYISKLQLTIPTLSIISTGGNLASSSEPNDSVVTVASQKALRFGKKVEVKANHFEILQHEKTVKLIADMIFKEET
jgi:pimeloyl-ACP methyl ester carboxylesterase